MIFEENSNDNIEISNLTITAYIPTNKKKIKKNLNSSEYNKNIIMIGETSSIENFWTIFQHLKSPKYLIPNISYHIFKKGIKPLWEDKNNKNGGKFSIEYKKEYSWLPFEEILFGLLTKKIPFYDEINGFILVSKKLKHSIQIWVKFMKEEKRNLFEAQIREYLQIPSKIFIDYSIFNC